MTQSLVILYTTALKTVQLMYIDKGKEKQPKKTKLLPKRKKNYVMCICIPQKYIQGKLPETSVNQATLRKRKAEFYFINSHS